jgi:hypothetical protein
MFSLRKPKPETDPRFPSGPWVGFFLQKEIPPGKHMMELDLLFSQGNLTGEGRDRVGKFLFRGRYDLADGRCHWSKRYIGKHDAYYEGFNEGKGIWGIWQIPATQDYLALRGGFHIWPKGMADPTGSVLAAEADLPLPAELRAPVQEPVAVPAGAGVEDQANILPPGRADDAPIL